MIRVRNKEFDSEWINRLTCSSSLSLLSSPDKRDLNCRTRLHSKRDQVENIAGLLTDSQGQDLALTALSVPYLLDSGCKLRRMRLHRAYRLSTCGLFKRAFCTSLGGLSLDKSDSTCRILRIKRNVVAGDTCTISLGNRASRRVRPG